MFAQLTAGVSKASRMIKNLERRCRPNARWLIIAY
jgi:hypothetical protein